jgi:hypothetical protein
MRSKPQPVAAGGNGFALRQAVCRASASRTLPPVAPRLFHGCSIPIGPERVLWLRATTADGGRRAARRSRRGRALPPRAQQSPALRKGSETAASARGSPSCAGHDVDVTSGLRMESGSRLAAQVPAVGLTALAACTQRSDVDPVDRLEYLAPHSSGEEITIGADGIRNPRCGVSRELDG